MRAYSRGKLIRGGTRKNFLVVDHIPVEIFVLVDNFFDATLKSNWIFCKGQANFH